MDVDDENSSDDGGGTCDCTVCTNNGRRSQIHCIVCNQCYFKCTQMEHPFNTEEQLKKVYAFPPDKVYSHEFRPFQSLGDHGGHLGWVCNPCYRSLRRKKVDASTNVDMPSNTEDEIKVLREETKSINNKLADISKLMHVSDKKICCEQSHIPFSPNRSKVC